MHVMERVRSRVAAHVDNPSSGGCACLREAAIWMLHDPMRTAAGSSTAGHCLVCMYVIRCLTLGRRNTARLMSEAFEKRKLWFGGAWAAQRLLCVGTAGTRSHKVQRISTEARKQGRDELARVRVQIWVMLL